MPLQLLSGLSEDLNKDKFCYLVIKFYTAKTGPAYFNYTNNQSKWMKARASDQSEFWFLYATK